MGVIREQWPESLLPASNTARPISDLTRKVFLTYIDSMVVSPDREPDVFGAISHPARRWMPDLLVEADRYR